MATYVIYSDTTDGYVQSNNAAYATARSGGTLQAFTSGDVYLGQNTGYYVYEGFLSFDTSGVSGTPSSVTLSLCLSDNTAGPGFTINARAYDWGASLTTADFVAGASLSGNSLRASLATGSLGSVGSYVDFTSDASFVSNTANPVRLILCSSRTESNTTPTVSEYVGFKSADAAGTTQDPKLTIVTVTVTNVSASDSGSGTDTGAMLGLVPPPTAYAGDTFTDTDATLLSAHTPTGTYASGAWTKMYGPSSTMAIGSNAVYLAGASGTARYRHSAQFQDGYVEAVFTKKSTGYGELNARYADESNRYQLVYDNGGNVGAGKMQLYRFASGVQTLIGSYDSGGWGTSDTVRLECVGSTITAYVNGVARITVTDTTITASGYTALSLNSNGLSTTAGVLADDYVVYNAAVGGVGGDSGSGTDTASVNNGTATASASDTGAGTDTAATQVAITPRAGSPLTRSAIGSLVTAAAGGTVGTKYAHRAFPSICQHGTVGAAKSAGSSGVIRITYRRGTTETSSDGSVCSITSTDGGATWSSEQVIIDGTLTGSAYTGTPVSPLSNGYRPGVRDIHVKTLASGRIALVFTQHAYGNIGAYPSYNAGYPADSYWNTWYIYSDDNGSTWSTPVAVNFTGTGAPTFTYGNFGDDLVELPNGNLIVSCYALNSAGTSWDAHCARSTDGGATWTYRGQISGTISGYNAVETSLTTLADGSLFATFHTENGVPGSLYKATSTNEGASWTVTSTGLSTANRSSVMRHPDGDLIIGRSPTGAGTNQGIVTSTDNGSTWGSYIAGGSLPAGLSRPDWCELAVIGAIGATPNLGAAMAWETTDQTSASVYFRAFTPGATAGIGSDSGTGAESGSVIVSVGAVPITASDTFAGTDVATRTIVSILLSKAASDSFVVVDAAGGIPPPDPQPDPGSYRMFFDLSPFL